MVSLTPRSSREVRLAAKPDGLPTAEHFAVVETPLAEPGPGEVVLKNLHFLVFPGLRTLIGGETANVPLPPLRSGDALFGPAIGEVVGPPYGSPLRDGDLVLHMLGWRDYALVPAAECTVLDDVLPDPVAYLNQGSSAYGALAQVADVRPGDTVFITGASGAVGSLAGQIARLRGAVRVIGSTGSPEKADRLVSELGYDAIVLRGAGPIAAQLAEAAPDGIDVVLDNVGGEQLAAAIEAARRGARFVLVGALSGQLSARGRGGSAPVEIDSYRLLTKGITLYGYGSGADHPGVEDEWTKRFGAWLRSGEIRFPYSSITGIDRAAEALPELIGGRHFGAVIVEL